MNGITLSATFSYWYAECHDAECLCAECLYADCLYADCLYAERLYAGCLYAERLYAGCLYAERLYAGCLYAECRYAECLGATYNYFHPSSIFARKLQPTQVELLIGPFMGILELLANIEWGQKWLILTNTPAYIGTVHLYELLEKLIESCSEKLNRYNVFKNVFIKICLLFNLSLVFKITFLFIKT